MTGRTGAGLSRLIAGLIVGTALATGPAQAAAGDHPQLMPLRDAVVTYDVQPDGAPAPQKVTVWFAAEGARMRIDSPDGAASTLLDRTAQTVTILLHKQRIFSLLRQRSNIRNPFLLDVSMQFHKDGVRTVAGLACNDWAITTAKGQASACVTEDGLILSESGVDADGAKGQLTALSVSYQTIPASSFAPPAGYQEVVRHPVASAPEAAKPVLGPTP